MSDSHFNNICLAYKCAPYATLLADLSGKVVSVNPAFESLTSLSKEQCEGSQLESIVHNLSDNETPFNLENGWKGDVKIGPDSNGSIVAHVEINNIEDKSGAANGFLLTFSATGKAYQERLERLGSLAGGIVHDMNNLLTGLLGHVSYLRMVLPQNGPHIDSLMAIENGSRRASSMTQKILEYSRGDSSQLKVVNFGDVLQATLHLLSKSLPDNIEMDVHETDSNVFVFGDENKLHQLITNLATNAAEAMPGGGKLTVGISVAEIEEDEVIGGTRISSGEYLRLVVSDTGMGMPEETKSRIFEPFFTTKDGVGTGLGLATVSAVVKLHRGLINVESQEGQGTTFVILLPVFREAHDAPGKDEDLEIPSDNKVEQVGGDERILVVDDEDSVRYVIQQSLEHLGYLVDVAENGLKAIELYKQEPEAYQLVVLDMMMPGMSGDELFNELKKIDPNVPILISSAYADEARAQWIMQNGGLGYIQKPFAVEELAKEVRICLDRKGT